MILFHYAFSCHRKKIVTCVKKYTFCAKFFLKNWQKPFFLTISTVSSNLFPYMKMAVFTFRIPLSVSTDHHYTELIMGLIKAGITQNTLI